MLVIKYKPYSSLVMITTEIHTKHPKLSSILGIGYASLMVYSFNNRQSTHINRSFICIKGRKEDKSSTMDRTKFFSIMFYYFNFSLLFKNVLLEQSLCVVWSCNSIECTTFFIRICRHFWYCISTSFQNCLLVLILFLASRNILSMNWGNCALVLYLFKSMWWTST